VRVCVWRALWCVRLSATGRSAPAKRSAASRYDTFTPSLQIVGNCELAAIVGGAPCKGAALSGAGARVQGVVNLAFTIDRQGKVVSGKIVKSSGSTALDDEALDMIKRAAPLPIWGDASPVS
jgi:TonB family protein